MREPLSAYFDSVVLRLRHADRWQGLRWIAQGLLVLVPGACVLALLAGLTLQWWILPHIEDWRPALEAHASRAVGVPVRIGRIEVRSSGWVPALDLRDVVVSDASGAQALRLPHVFAALSPRSLWALEPRLAQLYVEGARLLVRRDARGGLHVGGLEMGAMGAGAAAGSTQGNDRAFDWLFSQQELVLRHGVLRWVDEQRHAAPLELSDVDIVVRNGLRSHDIRVDATPPTEWGARFALRVRAVQPLLARPGDWRRWSGQAYADLPRVQVADLERHVDLPFELRGGSGALRGWLELKDAAWREATVDLRLRDVAVRLSPDLPPLDIARMDGRLNGRRDAQGVTLRAQRFGFETAAGGVWPRTDTLLSWRQTQTGTPVTGGFFSADRLDLQLMSRIADSLPLPAFARQALARHRPEGIAQDVAWRWDGPPDAPRRYRAQARLRDLSIADGPAERADALGHPGLRHAQLDFEATERGGQANLGLDGGVFTWPGLFDEAAVRWDRFAARVEWQVTTAGLSVTLPELRFANEDAAGELQARWHRGAETAVGLHPPGGLGWLELRGSLQRGRASRIARYLPRSMPRETRDYLRASLRSGDLSDVRFEVRGDLANFPFHRAHAAGDAFRIAGHVDGLTLDYAPPRAAESPAWPVFTQVQGDIVLDRDRLDIANARGQAWGVALQGVQGGIAALLDRPTLVLRGHARGPLEDYLRYLAQSPVGGWLGGGLKLASGSGAAELTLNLTLPLQADDQARVDGTFLLDGDEVRLRPGVPPMSGTRARIAFDRQGFHLSGQARLLGGDASFEGGSQADGSLRFDGRGIASAAGLGGGTGDPALARLAGHLTGQTPYGLQLDIAHGRAAYTLTSSLVGLGARLPAPLDKPAEAAWPLRVQSSLAFDPLAHGPPRETLRADLGSVAHAEIQRELGDGGPRPLRSAFAVGTPLPPARAGGVAVVRVPRLDADAWRKVWRDIEPTSSSTSTSAPSAPGASAFDTDALASRLPALDLTVDDFRLGGKSLGALSAAADASDEAGDWRLTRLALTVPEAQWRGSGTWRAGTSRQMALDFTLDLNDSGAFLERLGLGRVLKGGKGRLGGTLAWNGSPLALDYPSLNGALQLSMDAGRFLKVNTGAGRLLGVLSLQSLPRRLTLDFRDLFQAGFAFDHIDGDVRVSQGVARTNDLRMRGLDAAVLMEGRADLKAETQDLRVVVVPEINAGTASLAYAAINPAIGLGTFLAQLFLRQPLMRAGTREFHVTGPWDEPRVEAVERRPANAVAPASPEPQTGG